MYKRAAQIISRKRKELGLSQFAFGELVGLKQQFIQRMEQGRSFTFENINKIISKTDINKWDLLPDDWDINKDFSSQNSNMDIDAFNNIIKIIEQWESLNNLNLTTEYKVTLAFALYPSVIIENNEERKKETVVIFLDAYKKLNKFSKSA